MIRRFFIRRKLHRALREIGTLTVFWSYLEGVVDELITEIYLNWDGGKVSKRRPRTALNRKITFLKDWHKANPQMLRDFDAMVEEIEAVAEYRHDLIHGALVNIEGYISSGSISIVNLKYKDDAVQIRKIQTDIKQLQSLTQNVVWLTALFGNILEILQGGDDNADDTYGAMLRKLPRSLPAL